MNQLSPDEKFKRELYQQAYAIFAVYNPTDQDYRLIFDRRIHVIPNKNKNFGKGNGIEYLNAYLAKKYATEMTNKLLQEEGTALVKAENDRRREAGMALLTKYPSDNPQQVVEEQVNVNDPKTREKTMKSLIKGLVQKAPEDIMLAESDEKKDNTTPMDDQIFNSFADTQYSPEASPFAQHSTAFGTTTGTTSQAYTTNITSAKENLITHLEQTTNETPETII